MTVSRVSIARTVADIGLSGDRRGEDDTGLLLQADEGVAARGIFGSDIVAGDRNQAAALGKPGQRGTDMAYRSLGKPAVDIRRCREGRVDQHHARPDRRIEAIVDLLGVMAADIEAAEQAGEQPGAGVGDFV